MVKWGKVRGSFWYLPYFWLNALKKPSRTSSRRIVLSTKSAARLPRSSAMVGLKFSISA